MDLKKALNEGWINEYQQIEIDKTITALCNHMGGSERIKNTIFPTTYSYLTKVFIWLFVVTFTTSILKKLLFEKGSFTRPDNQTFSHD